MNKEDAVYQIKEIKRVLPEHLQIKLIEAVKVLARFKMINVKDDMPYYHNRLIDSLGALSVSKQCVVRTEDNKFNIDNMAGDIDDWADDCYDDWEWQNTEVEFDGPVVEWLPLVALTGDKITDEYGNELNFD